MSEVSSRPPTLVTARLGLRALETGDAPDVFRYARNPQVARFTLWEPHQDVADSLEFITGYAAANYSQLIPDPFGITLLGEGRVVGTVGCFWVSREHRSMELGYALDEQHWGRGVATEAARAVLDYVFSCFEVERVQARCRVENSASLRVLEKLGMRREGTLRSAIWQQDAPHDLHLYAVLKGDPRPPATPPRLLVNEGG